MKSIITKGKIGTVIICVGIGIALGALPLQAHHSAMVGMLATGCTLACLGAFILSVFSRIAKSS
jgi:hypothetical protein